MEETVRVEETERVDEGLTHGKTAKAGDLYGGLVSCEADVQIVSTYARLPSWLRG